MISNVASQSPHKLLEALGPLPGHADPYIDLHANDGLCWGYTMVMVLVQIVAYGRVSDNREIRKEHKVRKLEKEKEKERAAAIYEGGHANSTSFDSNPSANTTNYGSKTNGAAYNGHGDERSLHISDTDGSVHPAFLDGSSDTSLIDTSEEEVIV